MSTLHVAVLTLIAGLSPVIIVAAWVALGVGTVWLTAMACASVYRGWTDGTR